jgi:hypothetical protein
MEILSVKDSRIGKVISYTLEDSDYKDEDYFLSRSNTGNVRKAYTHCCATGLLITDNIFDAIKHCRAHGAYCQQTLHVINNRLMKYIDKEAADATIDRMSVFKK